MQTKKSVIFVFYFMLKRNQIVSFLFMALFISYHAGTTLFYHKHTISGKIIVHSHIHTDAHHNTKSGGHNENSIKLIAQISHFEYIDFSCFPISKPSQFSFDGEKTIEKADRISSIHLKNLSLRAPPIV